MIGLDTLSAWKANHPQTNRGHDWLVLISLVTLCLLVGGLGGLATAGAVRDWYPTLMKPAWTPPSGLFGPVWTFLYLSMAVAAWLVWRRSDEAAVTAPMVAFGVQLALNLAWSFLFFGLRSPLAGLVEIVLLWLAVLATLLLFRRVSRLAAWLFVPYLAWVSFATALNFAIWRLNS